jgi:hypothetical protein
MRRLMTGAMAAVLSALLVGALTIGCGGNATKDETKSDNTGGGKAPPKGLTAVEAKGKGKLKGKITFAGAKPDLAKKTADLQKQMKDKDEAHCLAAGAKPVEKEEYDWRIGPDGGLGNVFVWVAPPKGKFFKIDPADITAKMKEPVVLDQPHCAFTPHAFVLFPKYRDPAKPTEMKETGQTLIVKNSGDVPLHNTKLMGGDDNPEIDKSIATKAELPPMVLNPSPKEVAIKCSVHPWMAAYARVFDHPYATVSKEDGTYEIDNVPAGAEVNVVVWHENAGYVGGASGKTVTLKEGDNPPMDFEVKAP